MTAVRFYHNAADRLRVACVLSAKAHASGRRVSVLAPDAHLAQRFDQMLWSFQPLAFIPHVGADSPLAAETPVVIATRLDALPHRDILLNLGDEAPPAGLEGFNLIIDIVGTGEAERLLARGRFRHYKQLGFPLESHDLAQRSGE